MSFGWKVDDVFWVGNRVGLKNEHFSRLDFLPLTSSGIGLEVIRKSILELQRNSPAHDANTVDGVDQCFDVSCEDVARVNLIILRLAQ